MRNEAGARWMAWVVLLLPGVVSLFLIAAPGVTPGFAFHPRTEPWWRGMLPQLVHLGSAHAAANLLMYACLLATGALLGLIVRLPLALLASMIAVALGLTMESVPLAWYVGLSGALHGVFVYLLAECLRRERGFRRGVVLLIFVGTCSKLLLEVLGWLSLGATLGVPPAPQAHVFGACGAGIWCLLESTYLRARRTP